MKKNTKLLGGIERCISPLVFCAVTIIYREYFKASRRTCQKVPARGQAPLCGSQKADYHLRFKIAISISIKIAISISIKTAISISITIFSISISCTGKKYQSLCIILKFVQKIKWSKEGAFLERLSVSSTSFFHDFQGIDCWDLSQFRGIN